MRTADDWRPSAAIDVIRRRATLLARARDFFAQRDVLEVSTPSLCDRTVTDPHIDSIACRLSQFGERPLYLRTSPEYSMKRLLAAYRHDIYEIGPAFRDGEAGRYHRPEFTLIEWYRQNVTLDEIIDETRALLTTLAADALPTETDRVPYADLFRRATGLDPLTASTTQLADRAHRSGMPARRASMRRADTLDFLFGQCVVPTLTEAGLVIVTHYPAEHAALARLDPNDRRVAERFEFFWNGLELANGYRELTEADEQRARFDGDRDRRAAAGRPEIAIDEQLLGAIAHGLPECCGVALGFDRLLMRIAGLDNIGATACF